MKKFFKKVVVFILVWEAKIALFFWKPKIIAITGSVGKTSTKDAIFAVFSKIGSVRRSEKSFNSEIGIPLTILNLKNAWNNPFLWILALAEGAFRAFFVWPKEKWLILEVGADRPGDIKKMMEWIKPDISVITKIGETPVHVEFFSSPESLAEEKSYLAKGLKKDGTLVYFADDKRSSEIGKKHLCEGGKAVSFGFSAGSDLLAYDYAVFYDRENGFLFPSGFSFKAKDCHKRQDWFLVATKNAIGKQHVYPALAALCVASIAGVDLVSASFALTNRMTPPGRMKIISGIKNTLIIDDSYNASPTAVLEALSALKDIDPPISNCRKIAVLGDMKELGSYSREAHLEVGRDVAIKADFLFSVGSLGVMIAEGALLAGMSETKIFQYENSAEAGRELQNFIRPGDIILIKASQSIRMEFVVKEVMKEPQKAKEFLVRQEKEWSKY